MPKLNRRKSIKTMALSAGMMLTLPAWARRWSATDIGVSQVFSPTEQQLLSSVADAIIPTGDSIGALSVGVDKFLSKLFADCYPQDIQDNIKSQLFEMSKKAEELYGITLNACTQPQRMAILEQFACSTDEQTKETFQLIKSETIRGFSTSKEVMTKYYNYQVIPGHYFGCVDVTAS